MIPVNNQYPAFAANQVLSSEHLNQLFAYLDEQERLTRTNLIGIGIVCGLEPRVAADGRHIRISKGCGVTSEGYLVVWEDVGALEWYRPYQVPDAIAYREFTDVAGNAFPIWELMPDRNNAPDALALSSDFLTGNNRPDAEGDEKILVLFLECKQDSNRNCSPNNCDDKGATVAATVRPLLLRKRDMDQLQARIRALGGDTAAYFSLAAAMSDRLGLAELRLPRFDVAATVLGTTGDVFQAFQRTMTPQWVGALAQALSRVYEVFQPVLVSEHPANPFASLVSQWAFLHNGAIMAERRYLWYQYYYDHLDTILQAYQELRDQGLEIMGLCCPDSRLFPRHLMLANVGVAPPDYSYRHTFVHSPLFGEMQGGLGELRDLFQRLVLLVQGLELPPAVSAVVGGGFPFTDFVVVTNPFITNRRRQGVEIKITPSQLRSPLSTKAIPYHYQPAPLYRYWNYRLSRQGKAHLNLGYRHPAWNSTDDFVRQPLHYDLEPHNFLRIEGHIGQPFQQVMAELLTQKNRYRLPIDVVAIQTGRNADDITLPDTLAACHFQDLEALYDAFREELLCQLCETVRHLYDTIVVNPDVRNPVRQERAPGLAFLQSCAPEYRYFTGTVGELYENNLALHGAGGPSYQNVPVHYVYHIFYLFHVNSVAEALGDTLATLDWLTFQTRYNALRGYVRLINRGLLAGLNEAANPNPTPSEFLDLEEFSDQLDQLLYACKLESLQAIREEYERRVQALQQAMLLSQFARKHPGLQHKAGVPLGGTFVVVYHGETQAVVPPVRKGPFRITGIVLADGELLVGASIFLIGTSMGTVTDVNGRFAITVPQLPLSLEVRYTGYPTRQVLVTNENQVVEVDVVAGGGTDIGNPFQELNAGTVIADFFLPYLCCSDCQPIQFVLPQAPPTFAWQQVGCTNPNGVAPVLISPDGGVAPYEYTTDGGSTWQGLPDEPVDLADNAPVRIRDAEGRESAPQTIRLRPPLVIDFGEVTCNEANTAYSVAVAISGGQPPYTLRFGEETVVVQANQTGSATFPSGQSGEVIVTDSSSPACEIRQSVAAFTCEERCTLPCEGITLECGYPFFAQLPLDPEQPYFNFNVRAARLVVIGETPAQQVTFNGSQLKDLTGILNPGETLGGESFDGWWRDRLPSANKYIQSQLWPVFGEENGDILTLDYESAFQDAFTVLRIERYRCFSFELEIVVQYNDRNENQYETTWRYIPTESAVRAILTNPNGEAAESRGSLPSFNCIERNRCEPETPARELCTQPFGVKAETVGQTSNPSRIAFRTVPASVSNLPTLWYAERANPLWTNGNRAQFNFPQLGSRYDVRVIVVNPETGCAAAYRMDFETQLG